ncbi:MAG: hypothetical protein ACR2FX_00360 [Chthoniobacterales bacterium]
MVRYTSRFSFETNPRRTRSSIVATPFGSSGATGGIKAVVADDDGVLREIVCAPLRKWGFDVL